ncbi:hypothetical protein GUJ93_ZPchr0004g39666 [Zizania palustris]|uniref:Uncharacterized protein n=1 Tax=Zizania palustris TaxID=103762 RepID=A0A8J5RZH1_ZIZPA|nr:hypothetical protein GUJ93_ZPchr0004g39666 [Zizania palustris]
MSCRGEFGHGMVTPPMESPAKGMDGIGEGMTLNRNGVVEPTPSKLGRNSIEVTIPDRLNKNGAMVPTLGKL